MTTSSPALPKRPANMPCAVATASSDVARSPRPCRPRGRSALTTMRRAAARAPTPRSKVARVNVAIGRGRDPVALQEVLGEGLGTLELRAGLARAEAAQARARRTRRRCRPPAAPRDRRSSARSGSLLRELQQPRRSSAATSTLRTRAARAPCRRCPAPRSTSRHARRLCALPRQRVLTAARPPTMSTLHRLAQCRKWRMPVKTMAIPCSLAAAMTSASRIEPPGWITAVMPCSAATSTPSRNGKNASDATTEPRVLEALVRAP